MRLDVVHDIQTAYRKVMNSLARPGLISNLGDEAEKVSTNDLFFPSTEILALMLLDAEVTFKVFSQKESDAARLMNQLTYAKAAPAEKADYIFVLHDCGQEQLAAALRFAKTGSLINPHEAAALIIETESVSLRKNLVLTGPGIETERTAGVSEADTWIAIREEKNKEYPLGIDMIFIDSAHSILGLPRTTQIRNEVKS